MIDWGSVLTNGLWIVGLAAALAILSWASWLASREVKGLRATAKYLAHSPGLALSIALIAMGAALSVVTEWERIVWLLLAAGFSAHAIRTWQRKDPDGGQTGTTR